MGGWKNRKIVKILILFFLFGWEWKSGGKEKASLYKFTYIPLLKNDSQLKQKKKSDKQLKKKITQIIKK